MTELDIKRKATELLQKGRYDEAIAEYQALLESSRKTNPAVLNLIGDIWIKAGNHERAFESFLHASKIYTDEGLYHNAIAVGKKILRLDRDQTEVYGMLGNLYARQGLGMDCVKFLAEFARRKDEAGEYPAALAAFAEACETIADFPDVHVVYGELLERVDRNEDAAASFETAAKACTERGETQRAAQWRTKAAELRGLAAHAGPASAQDDDDDGELRDASQLMSLRSLDDSAPPRTPPAPKPPREDSAIAEASRFWGRDDEPMGLTLDDPADESTAQKAAAAAAEFANSPWRPFDPTAHPHLPPPPPLPGRAGPPPAAAPPPATTPAEHEPLELHLGPLDEATEADEAPQAADPNLLFMEPAGLADDPAETIEAAAEAPVEEPDLTDLPGIIAPPPRGDGHGKAATPASSASVERPASTADASGPGGLEDAPDLAEFFEQTARGDSEQAVVIGDDFELVREGGDVSEVIADFRDATMEILDLDDHQAHYDLGTTYMEMELFDEAAAEYEIAARGEGFALPSREMLGYCFLRKGQIDLAIKELERGLAISGTADRDKLGLLYNLGIACGVLDQEERAIAHFQRIMEVDPDFRDTQARLERLVQNKA